MRGILVFDFKTHMSLITTALYFISLGCNARLLVAMRGILVFDFKTHVPLITTALYFISLGCNAQHS